MNETTGAVEVPVGKVRCSHCEQLVDSDKSIRLGGRDICAACKSKALQMLREGVTLVDPQSERARLKYWGHEASVRAAGSLFLFGGCAAGLLAVLGGLGAKLEVVTSGSDSGAGILFLAGFGLLAGLSFWAAFALWRLNRSGRIVGAALAVIGLLLFPFGTIAGAYVLWLLLSKKGGMVFSDHYRRVIADSPQVSTRIGVGIRVLFMLSYIAMSGLGYWLLR